MARRLLVGCVSWSVAMCAACALLGKVNPAKAEDKINNQEMARVLVEQALAHEAAGDIASRDNALFAALQFNPACAEALWQSGYVRYKNQWVKFDEMPQRVTDHPTLVKYRKVREDHADTVEGQIALAEWCRKNNLDEQMRSHLTRALFHDPDHTTARDALGYVRIDGDWVLRDELEAALEIEKKQRAANQIWLPRLEAIARQLASDNPNRQHEGARRLNEVTDPLAIPSIEATLSTGSDELAVAALECISSMPQFEATLSLARHALSAQSENTRSLAASLLKQRTPDEYVPALLACMSSPITSRTEIYQDRGGAIVYRHMLAREGRDAQEVSVLDRAYKRVERQGGNGAETAARALADAQRLAQTREQAITAENAAIARRNQRVADVLAFTTGENLGPKPEPWWEWWNDANGVYVEGEKTVRSNYESETIRIADRGETGGFRTGSEIGVGGPTRPLECLKKGTPILTDRGLVAVEKIQVGDCVLSQDPITGELAYKPVLRATVRPTSQLIKVVTDTVTIEASEGHPFWVQGQGWTIAKFLKTGARLQGLEHPATVQILEKTTQEETYNLVVADFHTYFIGEERVFSHDNTLRNLTNAAVPGLAKSR